MRVGDGRQVAPRKKRPFERIPHRKYGYGTKAAADALSERGYPITPRMLRSAADAGEITATRSPGGHRRFSSEELERYLCVKIDKMTPGA
jgi:excisionase family DNA binding protein